MKRLLAAVGFCCSLVLGHAQSFTNPILAGFYPDPSICRAGDDYYLVNSSFAYYPGLPLFHSKDLLNWKQIGYAMDRPGQLDLKGAGVSRGLFAPAISYHNGTFYIVCTEVSKLGNFVITAKDPRGPWSDPVRLPAVNGIDPSLFFDDNGQSYIVFNSIPPDNITRWNGHRTIRMYAFDADKLQVTGAEKLLINGGTDTSKHPVWIEGPHIYKKDGWYYLLCAEGGTGYNHSEVVFRSRSVEGPYVSFEKNPILTQRHLDPARPHPITTTGHADMVDDGKENWWAVFLGCRPYEGDYYNTGRETFMAPVKWENGWPQFALGGAELQYRYPINAQKDKQAAPFNGNYIFRDDFSEKELNQRYSFLRNFPVPKPGLTTVPGYLSLTLQPENCQGKSTPSFVGFRQPHLKGEAVTALRFTPTASNEEAGLLLFQNETHYYFLAKTLRDGLPQLILYKGPGKAGPAAAPEQLATVPLPGKGEKELLLKVKAEGNRYRFFYALKKNRWQPVGEALDAKFLSTKEAGGFVGCFYALYATSNGKPAENRALFNWLECRNNDEVYKQ